MPTNKPPKGQKAPKKSAKLLKELEGLGKAEAEVVSLKARRKSKRADYNNGLMSREQYAAWLVENFMDEDAVYQGQTSRGEGIEVEVAPRDKLAAGREYRQLMNWDEAPATEGAFTRVVRDIVADILG